MEVRFDSLNRHEQPMLTLCNPGSVYNNGVLTNVIAALYSVNDMEIVYNFNTQSELNFRIYKIRTDDHEETTRLVELFKMVQNRRLIFVEGIGYFMIKNVEDGFDGGNQYKDVSAVSVEEEIAMKQIPYIENNTYIFKANYVYGAGYGDGERPEGIIDILVKNLPLWTVNYISPKINSLYRTFEDVDVSKNILGFMLEDVQDAYECVFIFDCLNREINVYSQEDFINEFNGDTDIHITKDDVIDSIDISESADDMYTAISARGSEENVTIAPVNPIGSNTIYNFSYYYEWMSPELRESVIEWQNEVEESEAEYQALSLEYEKLKDQQRVYVQDLAVSETQEKWYKKCYDNIVQNGNVPVNVDAYNEEIERIGGTPITILDNIDQTKSGINSLVASCETQQTNLQGSIDQKQALINQKLNSMEEISNRLSPDQWFNEYDSNGHITDSSLYDELYNYITEAVYTDDYVILTDSMTYEEQHEQFKTLYERAKKQLKRYSEPTQEFDVDVENFVFAKDFERWTEQIKTGCAINVELDQDDVAQLFLSTITINYEDMTLNLTFGNRLNRFDQKAMFEDLLGSISKSANSLAYISEIISPIKNGEFNYALEALQTSRDLTMAAALASKNEEVTIDETGITSGQINNDGLLDDKQIKLTGRNIVFTKDGWDTCSTAIGEIILSDGKTVYGINAEAIIGDVIIGDNLHIYADTGKQTTLFDVVDGKISGQIGEAYDAIDGIGYHLSEVEQTSEAFNIRIKNIENAQDPSSVTTTTGYTFDQDGLTVSRSDSALSSTLKNVGLVVQRQNGSSQDPVLIAYASGVETLNLKSKQYVLIGHHSRFQDFQRVRDTRRTACFYVKDDAYTIVD